MSRRWRAVFALEIALCASSCVVWTVAPGAFLEGVFGFEGTDLRARLLLSMAANVVACAYVYLYARLLFERPFPLRAFRRLQEAMAIGDVVVLATSALEVAWLSPQPALLLTQVVLAAVWLAIRVRWLTTAPETPAPETPAPG